MLAGSVSYPARLVARFPFGLNDHSGPKICIPKKVGSCRAFKASPMPRWRCISGLYEGYVKNGDLLNERLAEIRGCGTASRANPTYADLVRGLGFEYNGMRFHELYFDNMTRNAGSIGSGRLSNALGEAYGGFEPWKSDGTTSIASRVQVRLNPTRYTGQKKGEKMRPNKAFS